MWRHYLLTLYRALTRHRLYAALNVLGLAVGIAVFLVLWLDVRFETGFDRWIPHANDVYRIDAAHLSPGQAPRLSASASAVVTPLLKADYPQIQAYTRVIEDDDPVTVGRTSDAELIYFVDKEFFQVLGLPLVQGDASTALSSPGNIVVSERIAHKYFGAANPLGAHMTVNRNGTMLDYRVAAVMKTLPADTHLKIEFLAPITPAFVDSLPGFNAWGNVYGPSYIRFRSGADAHAVNADLVNFVERRGKGDSRTKIGPNPTQSYRLELTALPAIHFRDAVLDDTFQPGVDPRVVASLGVVGIFTLVIAILNYVNLATARAGLRAREVAVRKVLGATRATLMVQFLVEAVVVALVAILVGVALTELALPMVNALGGSSLKLTYLGDGGVAPLLAGLALMIGLGAGVYPALLLSSFRPAPVLAASRMPGGGKLGAQIRNGLVVVQFAAAIGFAICTLVLSAQAKYLHDADRGFKRDGLILVDSLQAKDLLKRQNTILDVLRAVPGVKAVSISNREPASPNLLVTNVQRKRDPGPGPDLTSEQVGPDYFRTYGIPLVAGRTFDSAHQLDDVAGVPGKVLQTRGLNTVLNQTGVRMLGFSSATAALGQTVMMGGSIPMTVIGVVPDVRFMSPHQAVRPIFYTYGSREIDNGSAAVRYDGVDSREMMARLAAAWRQVVPGEPFVAKTADARLSDYYVPDQQRARLFTAGALLAVAIGCVGLYGMASFNTARRVKEIGIRKTLGASTSDVLKLLVGQLLRPVLVANLIAWPLSWLAMHSWLSGFDQRIGLGPQYFIAATALTLLVALATVIGQALRVARAEPARALRYE